MCILFFFFFQAEDGIRDYKVTGVQTCALPICCWDRGRRPKCRKCRRNKYQADTARQECRRCRHWRSEEHTSELQSPCNLVCRLLLEKKKKHTRTHDASKRTPRTARVRE